MQRVVMQKLCFLMLMLLWGSVGMSVMAQLPEITDTAEAQTMMSDTVGTTEPLSVLPLAASISHEWTYDFTWEDLNDWLGLPDCPRWFVLFFGWLLSLLGPMGGLLSLEVPDWTDFLQFPGLLRLLALGVLLLVGVKVGKRIKQMKKRCEVAAYSNVVSLHTSVAVGVMLMIAGLYFSVWGMGVGGFLILLRVLWQLKCLEKKE